MQMLTELLLFGKGMWKEYVLATRLPGGMAYIPINTSDEETILNENFKNGITTHGVVDKSESIWSHDHHLEDPMNATRTIVINGPKIVSICLRRLMKVVSEF